MKLKHLESHLSSIQREFPSPKVELEQYPTSAHLAAWVGLTALENDDIGEGRSCLDLGCGTGMLAMSCALLDTDLVLAVDCDEEAIGIAESNCQSLELEDQMEFVLAQIKCPATSHNNRQANNTSNTYSNRSNHKSGRGRGKGRGGSRGRGGRGRGTGSSQSQQQQSSEPIHPSSGVHDDGLPLQSNCVDTVITNPPFGTKQNAGMDVQFLRTAVRLARRAVYSFHKTSTRDYLIKTLRQEEWNVAEVKVVAEMKFDIPNMYKFHQKKSVDVEVDLIRVELKPSSPEEGIATNTNQNNSLVASVENEVSALSLQDEGEENDDDNNNE